MSFPQRILAHHGVRQFAKFGIVGASSTAINFAVLNVCLYLFHVGTNHSTELKDLSLSLAFLVSVINGYHWNRKWTFRPSGEKHRTLEFIQFATIAGVGLTITIFISHELVPILTQDFDLKSIYAINVAQACATVCVMFWNFFANRMWTFKS